MHTLAAINGIINGLTSRGTFLRARAHGEELQIICIAVKLHPLITTCTLPAFNGMCVNMASCFIVRALSYFRRYARAQAFIRRNYAVCLQAPREQPGPGVEERSIGNFTWKYVPCELSTVDYLDRFRKTLLPIVRPTWNPNQLDHTVFDGGMSNFLAGIYEEDRAEDTVLIRIDRQDTEIFSNRDSETVIMLTLYEAGLLPPLYCRLKNAFCYGFAKGRELTVEEMQDKAMMERTSQAFARLHAVKIPAPFRGQEPQLWLDWDKWLRLLPSEYSDPKKNEYFRNTIGSVKVLHQELERLKTELSACQSQLVFCHNDTVHRNLIYNSDDDSVSLIDFEYSGPNFLSFDIGNHFCGFVGLDDMNYDLYPDEDLQKVWIRMYLKEAALLRGEDARSVTDTTIHTLYREANKFALASHLFWCTWGLLESHYSDLDYDYIQYAGIRFSEFQRRKEAFYAL